MEDTKHALLCNWPRDVWSNMNLIDLTDHVSEISIEDMLAMAKNRGQRTLELMLMVMWIIWCVRNSKAHGGEEIEPNNMKESARVILEDFYQANAHPEAIVTPNIPSQVRWSPPCNGVIKINVDGGISSRNSAAGIGFVMRSHNGSVLVAGNRRVAYATSVIAIEANAIFWAIQVAIAKGFRNVILETDSNILVDVFLHNKELLQIRGLFLHIRRLCCSFTSCSWSFVRHEGNRVAHELARRALYDNADEVYDGFVPPSVDS
nr:reverse transcriptase [Tanacetum cinerariifolium]